MNSVLARKARESIRKYDMLRPGDFVVAGVSGGADSVALLHFLLSLQSDFSLRIMAAHINHNLRGEESLRDENFVRALCEKYGVELAVHSSDVRELAYSAKLSLEEAGRRVRYDFFEKIALENHAKIATAHTKSDSIETALLNFARGTALRGLCGIPAVRGNIIRPLIDCTRAEIEEYCAENGISFIMDSSNESDDYARNRLRRHVVPALLDVNAGLYDTMGATLAALTCDADYLDKIAKDALVSLDLGQNQYDRKAFLALDQAIRARVLLLLLRQHRLPHDRHRIFRLMELIVSASGAEQLSPELFLKSNASVFEFYILEKPPAYFEIPIDVQTIPETGTINVFSDKKIQFMHIEYENYEENIKYNPNLLKNVLDCAKIERNVKLRQRIPADAINLPHRGCTKTLRKLFNESKLTAYERGRVLVIADESGPVWVEGFGVCERVAVTKGTKNVLIMEVLMEGKG